jgi:hypothetical protein
LYGKHSTRHGKEIIIFSDGIGQAGGISFDEVQTNVYKLYRACRVGPDTNRKARASLVDELDNPI